MNGRQSKQPKTCIILSRLLKELGPENKASFHRFSGHITQSWEWGEFRVQTTTVKKVLRLGFYQKGRLSKVFQVFFHRLPHLPNTIAYLPRVLIPTAKELAELEAICRQEKAMFLKIEPVNNGSAVLGSRFTAGKSILPRHTTYIDLTKSEEELLSAMHEKTRYNIRLAQKKGVIIKSENTPLALENFISLLTTTETRQGFYSHYPDYYRLLWKTLRPAKMVYLLSAYIPTSGQQPVASIMLFLFKDFLYYPYGGSNPDYREFMAPHLLHWEAIRLGKKLGCKTYDLWGSYKDAPVEYDPWWGIYRFKRGFGGKEVAFPPTIDLPLSPLYPLFTLADELRWQFLQFKRTLLSS